MTPTILLFQFGDLGDTILTLPAIRAVRRRYPASRLVLLGKEASARYVRDLGLIDDVIAVDKHAFDRPGSVFSPSSLWHSVALIRRIRRERAGTAVLFHHLVTRWGTIKFAMLALASGARWRFGVDNGKGWFLTHSIPDRGFGAMHEAEYWLRIVELMDAPGDFALEAPITGREREIALDLLRLLPSDAPLAAIHPGTGWYGPGRRWPADRFVETASLMHATIGCRFVVVGTAEERAAIDEVADALGPLAVNLGGRTSVGVLAAVLARCDVVVANDSGVGHLAAAVGTPVVSIFGPSNDRAWRPLTSRVVAVDLPCRPCFYRDFETGLPAGCSSRECLMQVTPRMVASAARRAIAGRAVAS